MGSISTHLDAIPQLVRNIQPLIAVAHIQMTVGSEDDSVEGMVVVHPLESGENDGPLVGDAISVGVLQIEKVGRLADVNSRSKDRDS